jgi:hypothetical protein
MAGVMSGMDIAVVDVSAAYKEGKGIFFIGTALEGGRTDVLEDGTVVPDVFESFSQGAAVEIRYSNQGGRGVNMAVRAYGNRFPGGIA